MHKFGINKGAISTKGYSIIFMAVLLFSFNLAVFLNNYTSKFNSGPWRIQKDELSHFVMGSRSFGSLNYLRDGSLELNNFFGFNQIELKISENDSLRFDKVAFDLNFGEEGSYLLFLFRKGEKGCYALRLSSSNDRDNCVIHYSPLLEKKEKIGINYPPLKLNSWHRIEINFLKDVFRVYIDGSHVTDISWPPGQLENGNIGFKCGFNKVFLDNIIIYGHNIPTATAYYFAETFSSALPRISLIFTAFLISLFYHVFLFVITFVICRSLFAVKTKDILIMFVSTLKSLLPVSLASLVLQLCFRIGQYNILSLFYFGEIKLPSLRPEYIYVLIFISVFLYKIRRLQEARIATSKWPKLIAFALFSIFGLYFISQGSLFDVFCKLNNPAGAREKPVNINNFVLKYPLPIKLPNISEYALDVIFKLSNTTEKLLFVTEGAKFIVTANGQVRSGFELEGSPGDFSFNYTRPIKEYPLAIDKYYHFKLVKAANCMSAYIEGMLIDTKLIKPGTNSECLRPVIFLLPFNGLSYLKHISIDKLKDHPLELYFPLSREIFRQGLIFLFFILCFRWFCYMKKNDTKMASPRQLDYLQMLNLLLPFLTMYLIFKDLLVNDRLFGFSVFSSYVLILIFITYKNRQRFLVVLLCALIIVYSIFLTLSKPHVIFDLSPTSFSGFRSSMRSLARPPQQIEAFLYNNSFDDVYMANFSDKDKVLILGSSQTWGAGASSIDLTVSGYLEDLLNSAAKKHNIKVINCGINGSHSLYLGNFFNNFLINFKPRLIIINLSNNDYFFWKHFIYRQLKEKHGHLSGGDNEINKLIQERFKSTLIEKFIKPCMVNNIKVLFVEEPNSPENTLRRETLTGMQKVIAELSSAYDIPLVSPQSALDLYNIDSPIWWDFMHLSSLGQKILAQEIFRAILRNKLLLTSN
jgi:hypothetical protein